jgi:predicted TIM-barrel fold metal-dependent hydrolase
MRILDSSVESLVETMDRMGVDKAVATACPACADGLITRGNDIVIAAVRRFPGRLLGYFSVNPLYPREAERELARCVEAGLHAIKVHNGQGTRYSHPSYSLVWEFAAAHGLPILAHTWGSPMAELEDAAKRHPGITWILAHGGSATPEAYVQAVRQYPKVYVDTTLSRCPRGLVEWFVAQGIEDRLLWGTDMSFINGPGQLGRILFARIAPAQKERILGLNARRVFA